MALIGQVVARLAELAINVSRPPSPRPGACASSSVRLVLLALTASLFAATAATHGRPAVTQPSPVAPGWKQTGMASWYGPGFDGKRTASGEIFHQDALTAAHHTLPFGTRVRVTLISTGKSVVVRVNDRLPRHDRIIDLARGAARAIGLIGMGHVQLEVVE